MTSAVNLRVKVHPTALFQITDAYERRPTEHNRVIGTLLGKDKRIQGSSVIVKSLVLFYIKKDS